MREIHRHMVIYQPLITVDIYHPVNIRLVLLRVAVVVDENIIQITLVAGAEENERAIELNAFSEQGKKVLDHTQVAHK